MLSPRTSALGAAADEAAAEDERLRQAVGARLHAVADRDAPLRAVAEQRLEARHVLRRADQQDVADAGEHQRAERVVHHRLVVHRQQLLAERERRRVQARSRAAGEDDSLARLSRSCGFLAVETLRSSMRSTPCLPGRQRHVEGAAQLASCRAANSAAAAPPAGTPSSGSARSRPARRAGRRRARARTRSTCCA